MRVLVVEQHESAEVSLAFVLNRGNCDGGAAAELVAHAFGSSVERSRSDSLELLRRLGVTPRPWSGTDSVALRAVVGRSALPAAMPQLAAMFFTPGLSPDDLEYSRRVNTEHFAKALAQNMKDRALYSSLFGRGGYGAVLVDPREFDAEPEERVRAFAEALRSPENVSVVAAGDTDADTIVSLLENSTNGLLRLPPKPTTCTAPPAATPDRTISVIDVPGAVESVVSVGAVGAPFGHVDQAPLAVLSMVLDASLPARLKLPRRENELWALSINYRASGFFEIVVPVATVRTAEAVHGLLAELERARSTPPDEREVAHAIDLERPFFRSSRDVASSLIAVATYDQPADSFALHDQALRKVTPADVARVAREYLSPSRLRMATVADAARVVPMLQQHGLGPAHVDDSGVTTRRSSGFAVAGDQRALRSNPQ